jgi:hypothetical protein
MIAPLIKPIRVQGGTFYTFSSASEDLGLSFNDSQSKFRFSKFALLNIPNVGTPAIGENLLNFSNSPGGYNQINGSKTANDYLAESFQNYCLNLEAMVTSSADYDSNVSLSVSERVFYKWLKEIGAIRFRKANIGTEQALATSGVRFVEESESTTYSRVIKYVGDISILNTVRNNNNAFSEVYVYVPVSHGNTPVVLFNPVSDNNYAHGQVFTNTPSDPLNNTIIYGRTHTTIQPAGLSIQGFFDSDTNIFATLDPFGAEGYAYSYNFTTNAWVQEGQPGFSWWYSNPIENSYFTEPSTFTDPTNDKLRISSVNKEVTFLRSRLDGITTEFNTNLYAGMNASSVTNFGTYNETSAAQSFDFNAVLVYYDLYNPTTSVSEATNLFGILFLDNVDPLPSGGGIIPRLTKYKPNSITGDNGNSFGFRINLKFDVSAQDTSVETSINDYSPYSLELYMDALNAMVNSYDLMTQNNSVIIDLQNKFSEISSLLLTTNNTTDIETRLTAIEATLKSNGAIFTNNQNLLNLIERNYTEITNIYKNYTSVNMSYNIDLLTQGNGIILDKSNAGSITVSSSTQLFNIGSKPLVSIAANFYAYPSSYSYIHNLVNYTNYLKITDGEYSVPYVVDRDVILYINDGDKKWYAGQTMRISFKYGLNLSTTSGNFNFIVYTDSADKLNTGFPYSAEAAYITYTEFIAKGNSPIIEIICLNPDTYQFAYDIY